MHMDEPLVFQGSHIMTSNMATGLFFTVVQLFWFCSTPCFQLSVGCWRPFRSSLIQDKNVCFQMIS